LVSACVLSFHIYDKHKSKVKITQDNAIVAMTSTITTDKQAIAPLQVKLTAQVASIHPLKTQAQTSKVQAISNVAQAETDHPAEKADIDLVAQPLEQAITDQEQVSQATQTALTDSETLTSAEAKTVTDEATQITNLNTDLDTTNKQLLTEQHRKKLWRDSAIVSTSIVVLRVLILHF
jgi:valyl-tRNA synthetase